MHTDSGAPSTLLFHQNVFVTGEGADGALSDIERRKFTAEEGDHLTLLNGGREADGRARSLVTDLDGGTPPLPTVYNAFLTRGRKSAKWCHSHRLNFKALSRAVSIRQQLSKYLQRFRIPLVSAVATSDGDGAAAATAIRRCLVSGYFKNAAKFSPDGTYRLLREQDRNSAAATLHVHLSSVMFTRTPSTGFVIFHDVIETTKIFMRDLTVIDSDWCVAAAARRLVERSLPTSPFAMQAGRAVKRVLPEYMSSVTSPPPR